MTMKANAVWMLSCGVLVDWL